MKGDYYHATEYVKGADCAPAKRRLAADARAKAKLLKKKKAA